MLSVATCGKKINLDGFPASLWPGGTPPAPPDSGALGPGCRQLLLHVVEREVADVLAEHHVDDVFADVLRVVADALERPRDPMTSSVPGGSRAGLPS
jgi:hypothetical protein